jgi:hypothetical protein
VTTTPTTTTAPHALELEDGSLTETGITGQVLILAPHTPTEGRLVLLARLAAEAAERAPQGAR